LDLIPGVASIYLAKTTIVYFLRKPLFPAFRAEISRDIPAPAYAILVSRATRFPTVHNFPAISVQGRTDLNIQIALDNFFC
jgi:hypothetical protein